jgi:hypothetical protein
LGTKETLLITTCYPRPNPLGSFFAAPALHRKLLLLFYLSWVQTLAERLNHQPIFLRRHSMPQLSVTGSGAKVVQIRLERTAVEEVFVDVRCPKEWDNDTIESKVWDRIDELSQQIDEWDCLDDTVEMVEVCVEDAGECVQLDLT